MDSEDYKFVVYHGGGFKGWIVGGVWFLLGAYGVTLLWKGYARAQIKWLVRVDQFALHIIPLVLLAMGWWIMFGAETIKINRLAKSITKRWTAVFPMAQRTYSILGYDEVRVRHVPVRLRYGSRSRYLVELITQNNSGRLAVAEFFGEAEANDAATAMVQALEKKA